VGQIGLAVLALDADVQAACLCIAQIGAGADLEILLLTGAPSLDVAALDLQVGEVAGAAVQLTDGDLHIAEQLDGVLPELLHNPCVAPPRMLIAFLENHLQADGSVTIPKVLQPYMGGLEVMVPVHKK